MTKSIKFAAAVMLALALPATSGAQAANANGKPEGHKAAKPSEGTNLSDPSSTGKIGGAGQSTGSQKSTSGRQNRTDCQTRTQGGVRPAESCQ